ncbi:hypothetical protein O1L44_29755 [Streptomyces noursei]|nr:hypothetical protein [Streptomyces noursei]
MSALAVETYATRTPDAEGWRGSRSGTRRIWRLWPRRTVEARRRADAPEAPRDPAPQGATEVTADGPVAQ